MSRRDFMPVASPDTIRYFREWDKRFHVKHKEFYNPLPKHYQDQGTNGEEDKIKENEV